MKKSLISPFLVTLLLTHQTAFTDGGSVTNSRYSTSLTGGQGPAGATGATGPTGPTGATGPSFISSYGQLYCSSSQSINLHSSNTYVAIPFNVFSPSSNMDGSTSSPATLTVLEAGTYQVNISLYFSSEDSDEESYAITTYTVGISINGGGVVDSAAVYTGQPGTFSISYSTLGTFSVDDTVQFYMKTSNADGGLPFSDNVTILTGTSANLMQIAD